MAHVIDFKEAGFDSVLDELEWRGLISQSTDRDRLAEALNGEPITYYCGFDPTAASLHIGNLVQLINMRHLQAAGHHPIALVGGATGLIGDPRQSGERTLNPKDVVAGWADRLKKQIGGILETEGSNPVRFVSNYDWTASMNVIDFLRDVGKNFRMGTMLAKDTVPVASTPRKASPSPSSATKCFRATTSCTCSTSTIACWRSAAPTSGATSPPVWI